MSKDMARRILSRIVTVPDGAPEWVVFEPTDYGRGDGYRAHVLGNRVFTRHEAEQWTTQHPASTVVFVEYEDGLQSDHD